MHNFCLLTDEKTQAEQGKATSPTSHRQPATQSDFEPKPVFSESTFFVDVMGQQVNLKGVECLSWEKTGEEVMEEIDQEMSLEKKQSKLEKISKLDTGIKIIQGQPLPGSARNASYCANTRGESMALQSKLKSEGLGGFFPSSHLFLQEGSGACPWNSTSSCSPHSQVFSLKHAAPDSRGWDPEEADIKEEHLPSGDTPFLSPSCLKDGPFSRDWENETLIFWAILPGFHLPECPLHHPREMFYKDNHNLFNARHWIKCLTSMILSAPLQNGQWWRLNDPWHMKQAHVRHSKANFIDHLRLCR